ncbi:hypothetical protein RVR_2636 [Actinacidiphila reveromycinica]|uniref:Uncharacterized protein n=1 Tax=Actinacidiphila reveromycinica TaxID=659352 RepID=A0A7U3UQU9_9ACTN|nr:hypothetical protein [Streptomyces sp. SN-593]BBA97064.1 hypothetical protein RVR_2636 [Streptomyces sp. SN-593]
MNEQNAPNWDATQLLVAEYTQLREEIIKLVELQFQLVSLTVIAFGTVLSVGFQSHEAPIILVQPLVSLILGVSWLHHTFRIHRIAAYIRTGIEQRVGPSLMGWEHYVQRTPLPTGRPSHWALRAAFPASSVLALVAAGTIASAHPRTIVLFVLSGIATVVTVAVFLAWQEPVPEARRRSAVGSP